MHDSKENIIRTALKLFMHKGYSEVSLSDIVRSSGLSKGAFYHHFASKEACFDACVKFFFDLMLYNDFHDFPKDSLKGFINAHLTSTHFSKDISSNSVQIFLFFYEAMRRLPNFPKYYREQRQAEQSACAAVVARAIASGEISTDLSPLEVARMFLYLNDGIGLNLGVIDVPDEVMLEALSRQWGYLYEFFRTKP